MTGQEILNKLKELGIKGSHLHGHGMKKPNEEYLKVLEEYEKSESFEHKDPFYVAEYLFGEIYEIEQVGGEGEGDHYHVVWLFKNHDVYLRVDAFYDSWEGVSWDSDDLYEVRPQQQIITVYV